MTKGVLLSSVVLLCVATCQAAFVLDITDPNEAFLGNNGGEPIEFCAYSIDSISCSLDPEGWYSLSDQGHDPIYLPFWWPYPTYPGWGKANPTPCTLAELSMGAGITLQPGMYISIGNPAPNGTVEDLSFNYVATIDDECVSCVGVVIPEPATLSLLGLAAVGLRRRR